MAVMFKLTVEKYQFSNGKQKYFIVTCLTNDGRYRFDCGYTDKSIKFFEKWQRELKNLPHKTVKRIMKIDIIALQFMNVRDINYKSSEATKIVEEILNAADIIFDEEYEINSFYLLFDYLEKELKFSIKDTANFIEWFTKILQSETNNAVWEIK